MTIVGAPHVKFGIERGSGKQAENGGRWNRKVFLNNSPDELGFGESNFFGHGFDDSCFIMNAVVLRRCEEKIRFVSLFWD